MLYRKRTMWRLLSLTLALSLLAAACASDDGAADTANAALAEANAADSEAATALADAQAAAAAAEAALRAAEAAQAAADLAQATAEGNQEAVAAAEDALADAQDAAAAARDEAAAAQSDADAARQAAEAAQAGAEAQAAAAAATPEPPPPPPEPADEPMDDMAPPALVDKPEGWVPPEASMSTARAWPTGPAVEVPQLTVGYLQVLGASEAAQRLEFSTKDAVDYLGWDWEYCDAEGVPDQMQTCLEGFINSGVDAIVTDGTTVEVIVEGLARARDAGIPFVNSGGTQSFYHLYAGSFNPNDAALGQVLAEWMMENRGKDGPVQISSAGFAKWGSDREDSLRAAIEGTGVTIGAEEMVDFADVIGTAADATANWLLQAPDSLAFWLTFDLAALGVGPVIVESFPGVSPPDRPMVLTFYANCGDAGADEGRRRGRLLGGEPGMGQLRGHRPDCLVLRQGRPVHRRVASLLRGRRRQRRAVLDPVHRDAGGSRRRVQARAGPVPDPDGSLVDRLRGILRDPLGGRVQQHRLSSVDRTP